MTGYAIRRLLQVIPTVILSTALLFSLMTIMRGDAIDVYFGMSSDRTPEAVAALKHQLGIDKPLPMQYLTWLGKVARGDFGESWRLQEPVLPLILDRLSLSLELAAIASAISIVFSVIFGTYLALHKDSFADQILRLLSLIFISAPVYWVAIGLILILSRWFNWIPPIQYESFRENPRQHLEIIAIPATLWGVLSIPSFSRYVRNAVLDVLSADYVRTGRAKGLNEQRLLWVHVLRNAAGPLATVTGLSIGTAAGGTLLLEVVFNLPGMGRLWLTAISQRDHPLILGIGVVVSTVFVVVNLLTDLSYALFDPRVRYR
jgi:peptide/nickel transport system permease protein